LCHLSRLALRFALVVALVPGSARADAPAPQAAKNADPSPTVEVTVSGVERAPTREPATDYLVNVERLIQGSIPGTSLIVRVPGGGLPGLRTGQRTVLFLAPAADGSFRLLGAQAPRAERLVRLPLAPPPPVTVAITSPGEIAASGGLVDLRAAFSGPGLSATWEISPGVFLDSAAPCAPATFCARHLFPRPGVYQIRVTVRGEQGQTSQAVHNLLVDDVSGGSAGEKVVTGLFEGNGFVSSLAVVNLDGTGGRITIALKDFGGAPVGPPAVLAVDRRSLLIQPVSRLFPGVVGRRGPFSAHLTSDGVLFSASATLLDIETDDRIFVPATPAIDTEAVSGELFLPRVVRGSAAGTFQTSQLTVYNPANGPGQGRLLTLELWERGQDNSHPRTAYRFVDPGRTLLVEDVLLDLFGLEEGIGALRVSWSGGEGPAPRVVGLTFAAGGPAGRPEQRFAILVDTLEAAEAIRTRGVDLDARQTASSRSSFGLVNLSAAGTALRLTLRDSAGRVLGTTRVVLAPRQHLERNVAGLFQGVGSGRNWVVETQVVGGGPVLTYLAHVDSRGDLSFVPGHPL
jgi:hypothetical protein